MFTLRAWAHIVPESIIVNQLNLLYICSDNLSFFGVHLRNGYIAEIKQKPIEEATATSCGWLNPRGSEKFLILLHNLQGEGFQILMYSFFLH